MLRRIRIGLVGVGNMGQAAHLRNYVALSDCEVVAIAEPRTELAHAVAARYGVSRVYSDADEMIAEGGLDGLVAAQPFDRHGSIVAPLYRHGLPLLTEKPLASSIATGKRLLSALAEGGSWHMVGYHKRNDPAAVWAREQIGALRESGVAGAMRYVRITMPPGDWIAGGFDELIRSGEAPPFVPEDAFDPDMSAEEFRDYVSFVNYYIHQVNLLRFLFGEPYRVVFGNDRLLVAESESGVTGTIEMAPYETRVGWDESVLVGFDRGYVRFSLPAPLANARCGEAEMWVEGQGVTSPRLPHVSAMRQQAANFVSAIRGDARPACEAAEALEDLRVAKSWLALRG